MNSKKAKRIIEDDVDLNIAELAEAVPEYKKKNTHKNPLKSLMKSRESYLKIKNLEIKDKAWQQKVAEVWKYRQHKI